MGLSVIRDALKAFSFGRIQDAATIIKALERNGISTGDFLAHVAKEKRRRVRKQIEEQRAGIERGVAKCPSCRIPMVLRAAGPDPEDGSHWTCPRCRFGRYDPRPVQDVQKSIVA